MQLFIASGLQIYANIWEAGCVQHLYGEFYSHTERKYEKTKESLPSRWPSTKQGNKKWLWEHTPQMVTTWQINIWIYPRNFS